MSYLKEKQIRDGNSFLTDVISVRTVAFWRYLSVLSLLITSFPFLPLYLLWGGFSFVWGTGGRWEQVREEEPLHSSLGSGTAHSHPPRKSSWTPCREQHSPRGALQPLVIVTSSQHLLVAELYDLVICLLG